jgi:CheY-like chemotaxis protein
VEFGFRVASAQDVENHKAEHFASLQDDISKPDLDKPGGLLTHTKTGQLPDRILVESVALRPSQECNPDIVQQSASLPPPMVRSHSDPGNLKRLQEEMLIQQEQGRPLRVLVVDDDMLTRTLMTRLLSHLGCEVYTASDGRQFLDLLLGNGRPEQSPTNTPQCFDMVTLDNAMPVRYTLYPGLSHANDFNSAQVMTGELAIQKLRSSGRKDFVVGFVETLLFIYKLLIHI